MTENQTKILIEMFDSHPFPNEAERCRLAKSLNVSVESISVWFKNRRYRKARKGQLFEGELLVSKVKSLHALQLPL